MCTGENACIRLIKDSTTTCDVWRNKHLCLEPLQRKFGKNEIHFSDWILDISVFENKVCGNPRTLDDNNIYCKINKDCKNRCLSKLGNVKWVSSKNGWTTGLYSDTVKYFCRQSYCQKAYEYIIDNNRIDEWNSYKNDILDEFNRYYGHKFTVVKNTVNFY